MSLTASSGVISGTPTAAGNSSFTVQVKDAKNNTGTQALSISIVAAAQPPTVTTTSLSAGTVSSAYSATVSASGGTTPYTWSITAGALPAGLSLTASSGVISGTPTAAGNSSFTVQVKDAKNNTGTQALSISIVAAAQPPTVTTTSLSAGTVSSAYSATVSASGGTTPYTWSITAGALPAGLSLTASSGVISGTPTAAGSSSFTVQVKDAKNNTGTQALSISIVAAAQPPTVTTTSLSAGTASSAYSATVSASGGTTPYTWSITAGALPAGLSLTASSGVISGTPTAAGSSSFTVQVKDAKNNTGTQALSISIVAAAQPPTVTTTSLSAGTASSAYSATVSASGGTTPYTWSITAGALPAGLSLTASSGVISGTPTAAGSSSFTVQVKDAKNNTGTQALSISIVAAAQPPTVTTTSLSAGTASSAYSATVSASGGTTPYTWSITAGALPAGLSLTASSGVISGTPTAAGSSSFTVQVKDAKNNTGTQALSISIVAAAQPLKITTTSLGQASIGVAYSTALQATGGTPGYTWSVTTGQLPAGLSLLASAGQITGIATTAGQSNFTVQVNDSASTPATATQTLSLTVVTGVALDQYGGADSVACPDTSIAFFNVQLVGTHYVLCTPAGHAFWMFSTYVADSTDGGNNYASRITSKYPNTSAWTSNVTQRMLQLGFNTIGTYAGLGSHNMYPLSTYNSAPNANKMPFIYQADIVADCMNSSTYKTKNVYNGINTAVASIARDFPDVFDPNWSPCVNYDIKTVRMAPFTPAISATEPYMVGIALEDDDYTFGFGKGPNTPGAGGGHTHLGWAHAVTSPVQSSGPGGDIGDTLTYSDTQFHGKTEWLNWVQGIAEQTTGVSGSRLGSNVTYAMSNNIYGPADILTVTNCSDASFNSVAGVGVKVTALTATTVTVTLEGGGSSTTGCTVGAGPGYASIAAFNSAWGSTYSTFGSSGGWPKEKTDGTGLADEDGSSVWFPNGAGGGLTNGNPAAQGDLNNFLQRIANKFFSVSRAEAKAVFPNHMLIGPLPINVQSYTQVLIASNFYMDLPEYSVEPIYAASTTADAYNVGFGKAYVLWTTLMAPGESAETDTSWGNGIVANACGITGGTTDFLYTTQNLRGACYQQLVNVYWNAAGSNGNHPVVGLDWWELVDNVGQNQNFGLVSQWDNPYDGTCDVLATLIGGDNGFDCGHDDGNYTNFLGPVKTANQGIFQNLLSLP